ncbi:unnamed protein product, partial [Oppiella nova]
MPSLSAELASHSLSVCETHIRLTYSSVLQLWPQLMSTAMSKVDTNERKASGSQKQSLATRRSTSPVKLKVKTLGPVVRGKSQRKQLNGFTCK